jgi:hypothetical protein
MSGFNAGKMPEINLDEFEKRLRSAGATTSGAEDPLAELTRLMTTISQEGPGGDGVASPAPARMPKAESAPLAAGGGLDRPAARLASGASQAPAGGMSAPSGALEGVDLSAEHSPTLSAAVEEDRPRPRRPRSWYFVTAGLAVIGVALLAGAAALKIGAPSSHKTPPFIAAAEGPSKIQPPSDATVRSSGDAAALVMKDSATPAPVKLVTTEEQPLDLGAPTPTPTPAPADVAAAAVSPVAPAADTPIVAPAAPSASVAPLFPDANPVKTVSVRPDGTLISVDSTPTPRPPAPSPQSAPRAIDEAPVGVAVAAGEPATPKVDLPTKLSPKSSARVVAKTDTTAPAAATDTTPNAPLQLGAAARATKATKTPPAKAAPVVASAAAEAAAAPAQAAASEPATAGGDWAVQLAAPRSEADAQNAISRLKSKYSAQLGDADLVVRQAEVKGETIYRVRAGGLSKDAAAALCAKLKASGGDCFIAKE